MISKEYLKGLGFDSIQQLYNYIVESEENGQFTQVRELIQKLSQNQYNGFLEYLQDNDIQLKDCFLRD